jgi:hypothetical protein
MNDNSNLSTPPAATARRRRRTPIPLISVLVFIISALVVASATSAAAATKTLDGGTFVHATALWRAADGHGNTVVTQLDLLDGIAYDEEHRPMFGQGTTIELSRTVIDPSGRDIYTDDSFFGTLFTTTPIFHTDEVGKLRSATLAPVEVDQCVLGPSPCRVIDRSLVIQVDWTGTGEMATTHTAFKDGGNAPPDRFKIRLSGDVAYRSAPATGTLNGNSLGEPTTNAALSRTSQVTAIYGQLPGFISYPDYSAPTIDLGNKTVRGGTGTAATAIWIISNPDGSTTYYQLLVTQGYGLAGRVITFIDDTFVSLDKIVLDKDGNFVEFAFGDAVSTGTGTFTAKNNLSQATLAPTTVGLTTCSITDGCNTDETATVEANWVATSQRVKTTYRFTAITNCADSQCTTADQQHKFKITATGTGESVDAEATATFNDVDLGASTNDPSVGETFLTSGDRSTIEYGGSYPIDIYPLQAPKRP